MNMTREAFLSAVARIAEEAPSYASGHDGSDGKCDCIGLVIGAVRRCGGTWDGIHGSNYAARYMTNHLEPIVNADQLQVGELVYKATDATSGSYALPSRYSQHPDQLDYYHVGVVQATSPLRIVHCTAPGIVWDTKLGKWSHHGELSLLGVQETPASSIRTATVTAPNGSTVNLRTAPDGALVDRIPVGATVTIIDQQDGWCRITYVHNTGWMKSEFLSPGDIPSTGGTVTISLPRATAEHLRDMLRQALDQEG